VAGQALAGAKKKSCREGRTIVFIDESGLSERPTRVKTWAPKGQTPVLQYSFNWKQLSVVAGISFWNFYFRLHGGAIRGPQFVEFLQALIKQIRGKLLVIWDGLPAHRSRVVTQYVESLDGHIVIERLPAYAPELNPVEYIWGYMKQRELANLCLNTIGEVGAFARRRLKSMQRRPRLITAFWHQAELPI
jgi:transposase